MLSYDERPQLHGSMPTSRGAMKSIKNMNVAIQPHLHRHIWIITGPAGCGKSTVARHIADNLKLPYVEGDEVRHLRV